MKFGCTISFRPFGYLTDAFFIKHYIFNTKKDMWNFIASLPWYKRKYPFSIGYYCIPEDYL